MILKKDNIKISLVSIGTGNFQYLFPLYKLLNKNIKFEIFADIISAKLWKKNNIKTYKLNKETINKTISNKIIIMGMVCFKDILFKIIKKAKKNYIIQFFDNFTLIPQRFNYNNKFLFGDEIWSLNKRSNDLLANLIKKSTKIINIGHPGFVKNLNKKKKISSRKVLIVLQPMKKYKYTFTEQNLLQIIYNYKIRYKSNLKFFVKLHPENKLNLQLKNINIYKKNIYNNLNNFQYVIGFSSTVLTISYLNGIKTGRIVLNNGSTEEYKPYNFRVNKISSLEDMDIFFKNKLRKKIYSKDIFYKNADKKASDRIVKIIKLLHF